MANYQEFLDGLDRAAYHEGELTWEEDGFTVTRTYQYSPPGCHDSCGVLFYVKDGKLDHVEGDPLSPFTNGKLCMRCLDLPEIVNHPDRVLHPMKRAREDRGDASKFERITWDEAYDIIEEKTNEVKRVYGSESILCVHGTGRNVNWLIPFFGHTAFETPNVSTFGFTGFACYMPRVCGGHGSFGRLSHSRRRRGARTALRRPLLQGSRGHSGVGQRASGLQRRRLHRPLAGAVRADGVAHHLHRPAAHVVGRACGLPPAAASRHRCGAGLRVAERHHLRGPVRPRVRGLLDERHRRAVGGRQGHDAGVGRPHHGPGRGGHRRLGAPVRGRQQLRHPVGTGLRPAGERHGAEPGGVRPHGHLRQHRPPGRQHPGAQLLRDQLRLCIG